VALIAEVLGIDPADKAIRDFESPLEAHQFVADARLGR
jgi:hypothetical protein